MVGNSTSIISFGAVGDGKTDSTKAIQAALDSGYHHVTVPAGEYIISSTLLIDSDTALDIAANAKIMLAPGSMKRRGDFFLTNKDHEQGNRNISIHGGFFDANGKNNPKGALFDTDGCSGVVFNFRNVTGLSVTNLTLMNPSGYFVRCCRVNNFEFRNIKFSSFYNLPTNDGIHLGGFCENGIITGLRALTSGTTSDDMVALNADDCVNRVENLDMECGPIRNIRIRDLAAMNCHTFVRMLSVDSMISDIIIDDISGGCSKTAFNLDGARYCRTPIIAKDDPRYFEGAGNIKNVSVSNVELFSTEAHDGALVTVETNVENFVIKNLRRPGLLDSREGGYTKTLSVRYIGRTFSRLAGVRKEELQRLVDNSELSSRGYETGGGRTVFDCVIRPGDRLVLEDGGFSELSFTTEII